MVSVIDNPYVVGAHWFQYIDWPASGRVLDRENYNVESISVTDTPYQEIFGAAYELKFSLYERRYGDTATNTNTGNKK